MRVFFHTPILKRYFQDQNSYRNKMPHWQGHRRQPPDQKLHYLDKSIVIVNYGKRMLRKIYKIHYIISIQFQLYNAMCVNY